VVRFARDLVLGLESFSPIVAYVLGSWIDSLVIRHVRSQTFHLGSWFDSAAVRRVKLHAYNIPEGSRHDFFALFCTHNSSLS
jgi:hypothetical protein